MNIVDDDRHILDINLNNNSIFTFKILHSTITKLKEAPLTLGTIDNSSVNNYAS